MDLVVELRRQLTAQGLDAGDDTIGWHLQHHHQLTISRATIYRIIRRAGLVTAEPAKKPRSSYIRFQAEQPNETWQADFTHHRLTNGTDVEILTWLDDHSRYALSVTAHQPVTGPAAGGTGSLVSSRSSRAVGTGVELPASRHPRPRHRRDHSHSRSRPQGGGVAA